MKTQRLLGIGIAVAARHAHASSCKTMPDADAGEVVSRLQEIIVMFVLQANA